MSAMVTKYGAFSMQVCVPDDWDDNAVIQYAEEVNPSGTNGWHIRKEGDKALDGDPERCPCATFSDRVHIMLDA